MDFAVACGLHFSHKGRSSGLGFSSQWSPRARSRPHHNPVASYADYGICLGEGSGVFYSGEADADGAELGTNRWPPTKVGRIRQVA